MDVKILKQHQLEMLLTDQQVMFQQDVIIVSGPHHMPSSLKKVLVLKQIIKLDLNFLVKIKKPVMRLVFWRKYALNSLLENLEVQMMENVYFIKQLVLKLLMLPEICSQHQTR